MSIIPQFKKRERKETPFALKVYFGSYFGFVLHQEQGYLHIDTQWWFIQSWEKLKKD